MAKRNKFGAVRVTIDGHSFHSKAEAKRYGELRYLEMGGKIRNLELQPRYALKINGVDCGTYIADFRYFDTRSARVELVVEDVKGAVTALFRLKKKIVEAIYPGVTVREVRVS